MVWHLILRMRSTLMFSPGIDLSLPVWLVAAASVIRGGVIRGPGICSVHYIYSVSGLTYPREEVPAAPSSPDLVSQDPHLPSFYFIWNPDKIWNIFHCFSHFSKPTLRCQSKIWFKCIKDHREGEELTDSLSFRLLCSPLLSPDGVSPGWHRLWLCSDTSARCWLPRVPSQHLLTWFSHLSLSRVLVTWSLTWNVDFIISC